MTFRQAKAVEHRRDSRAGDRGFIMVAMLVSIAVAAVWMSALLPSWRQQAIREQEAELIFRGEQYARAIFLYTTKNNGRLPQNIDQLVQQHYLRKKYLDPITGKDFVPIGGLVATPRGGQAAPFAAAGISGVRSSSTDASIKIYYNQQVYSQWPFDWQLAARKAGAGAIAPVTGGGRGGAPGRGGTRDGQGGGTRGGRDGTGGGGARGGRGDELAPIAPGRGGAGGGRGTVPGGAGGRGF